MKRDKCNYCGHQGAEALYAVDGRVEWWCNECGAEWTTDLEDSFESVDNTVTWGYNNLGEEVE